MDNTPSETVTYTSCDPGLRLNSSLHISLAPAACIIGLLMFLHREKTERFSCGWRPGPVVPLNFLDGYKNRWSFAVAFGAISSHIPQLLLINSLSLGGPKWLDRILLITLVVIKTSGAFFPLFACLLSRFRLAAAVSGCLYSIFWLCMEMALAFESPNCSISGMPYERLIFQWPSCVFFVILSVLFARQLWTTVKSRRFVEKDMEDLATSHQMTYTRLLLTAPYVMPTKPTADEGWLEMFRYKTYPGFLFPARMLCVLFVILAISYQVFIEAIVGGISWFTSASDLRKEFPDFLNTKFGECYTTTLMIVGGCLCTSGGLLVILLASALFLIFKNYRCHFMQLCRGDKSFIPRNFDFKASSTMTSYLRWAGFQVAYFVVGYFVFFMITALMLFAIAEIIYILSLQDRFWSTVLQLLELFVLPFLINLAIYFGQIYASKRFFLQPSPANSEARSLAVKNRKSIETVNFVTFFYNIVIGAFSAIRRLIIASAVWLIIACRIDLTPFKRDFEKYDRGYRSYIGMLYVDYTHNHPVLRVFCSLLSDHRKPADGEKLESMVNGISRRRPDAYGIVILHENVNNTGISNKNVTTSDYPSPVE